jgi:hypothetical protein
MTARGRSLIADGLVRSTRKRGHAMSTLTLTRRDLALLTAIDAGRCQVVDPTVIDRRALSAERAPTPARPCPGTQAARL